LTAIFDSPSAGDALHQQLQSIAEEIY